jgi:putative multiple sugar transport system ATP-binding protein
MISHKLNEIAAIADSVTIIRDGKSVETLDVRGGDVDEDRIIKGMVGRAAGVALPRPHAAHRRDLLRGPDWTVEHPAVAGPLRLQALQLLRPPPARSSASPASWAPAAPS